MSGLLISTKKSLGLIVLEGSERGWGLRKRGRNEMKINIMHKIVNLLPNMKFRKCSKRTCRFLSYWKRRNDDGITCLLSGENSDPSKFHTTKQTQMRKIIKLNFGFCSDDFIFSFYGRKIRQALSVLWFLLARESIFYLHIFVSRINFRLHLTLVTSLDRRKIIFLLYFIWSNTLSLFLF